MDIPLIWVKPWCHVDGKILDDGNIHKKPTHNSWLKKTKKNSYLVGE